MLKTLNYAVTNQLFKFRAGKYKITLKNKYFGTTNNEREDEEDKICFDVGIPEYGRE